MIWEFFQQQNPSFGEASIPQDWKPLQKYPLKVSAMAFLIGWLSCLKKVSQKEGVVVVVVFYWAKRGHSQHTICIYVYKMRPVLLDGYKYCNKINIRNLTTKKEGIRQQKKKEFVVKKTLISSGEFWGMFKSADGYDGWMWWWVGNWSQIVITQVHFL